MYINNKIEIVNLISHPHFRLNILIHTAAREMVVRSTPIDIF